MSQTPIASKYLCPMCGKAHVVRPSEFCANCGEPIERVVVQVTTSTDRGLALMFTLISSGISVYVIAQTIYLVIQTSLSTDDNVMLRIDRNMSLIWTPIFLVWLWAAPFLRSTNAVSKKSGRPRLRLFWQTKMIIYAITLSLCLLFVTCAVVLMPPLGPGH